MAALRDYMTLDHKSYVSLFDSKKRMICRCLLICVYQIFSTK